MKRLTKFLIFILLVLASAAAVIVYSSYIAIENLSVQYLTVENAAIQEEFDGVKIGYFSDINYNGFMNKDRLSPMITQINQAGADTILFGGDLFDSSKGIPSQEIITELTEQLRSLEAPLGKFAVLGTQDESTPEMRALVEQILYDADFEILTNKTIHIRNGGQQTISLIGLDGAIYGIPTPDTTMAAMNPNEFNIVLAVEPDVISSHAVPLPGVDLVLSGNNYTSQINIPFIGTWGDNPGGVNYKPGYQEVQDATLLVGNGLGTLENDIRVFLPPTYYIIQLAKQK